MTIDQYLKHTVTIGRVTMTAGVRSVVETASVPAFITNRIKVITDNTGAHTLSETIVFLKPTQTIGEDDVVTFDGVTYPVGRIYKARDFTGVHHLEVKLGET